MKRAFWTVLFLVAAYLQLRIIDYEIRVWREYQFRKEHPDAKFQYTPQFRLFPSIWDF